MFDIIYTVNRTVVLTTSNYTVIVIPTCHSKVLVYLQNTHALDSTGYVFNNTILKSEVQPSYEYIYI